MIYVFYALGLVSLSFGLVPIWFSRRFKKYVEESARQGPLDYAPPATVMIPCKGTDLEFRENILSILDQDYPNYEILFVTGDTGDPAYRELADIIAQQPGRRMKLLVAGTSSKRAQKLTNLLYAAEHASSDSEVFVHLDADIRVRRDFLRHLIAPLGNNTVGVAAGFPWYMPRRGNVGSVLRSIWGGGALPLLIDDRHNLASGAANATRKETYTKSGIRQAMDGAVSDTFAITRSVKTAGQRIEFVPRCLFITPDESSLAETIRWTNRQTIISRVYGRRFWWTVALTYSFANLLVLLGLVLLALSFLQNLHALLIPSLLILSLIPLQSLNAAMLLEVIKTILPEHAGELERMKWTYRLLAPLGSVLIFANSVNSVTTNEIEWRGIRYRLVSPTQTVVLEGGGR
jgi:ceramide glucosyltransferase